MSSSVLSHLGGKLTYGTEMVSYGAAAGAIQIIEPRRDGRCTLGEVNLDPLNGSSRRRRGTGAILTRGSPSRPKLPCLKQQHLANLALAHV
jgi:hypothetical protein